MKQKLYIVTGNKMKFAEFSEALSPYFDCEQKVWDEPEIQGTPKEILKHKALRAYGKFQCPVLVEDTSFHFDELGGAPGPYIKYFMEECMTPYQMGIKFEGTKVRAVAWLGLAFSAEKFIVTNASINGTVVKPKQEDHEGRYFDLFFQLDGMEKPMIELSIEEKNNYSHRGIATQKLVEILKNDSI